MSALRIPAGEGGVRGAVEPGSHAGVTDDVSIFATRVESKPPKIVLGALAPK